MTGTSAARRIVLKRHPEGALSPDDFTIESGPVPEAKDGEILVRNLIVSVDPMLRLFIDKAPLGGKLPSLPPGAVIPGAAVAEVVASRHPDHQVGDLVEGRFGWQDYAVSNGQGINRVDPAIGAPQDALGIGGLPGFTAYVGLDVAKLQPGQTVLVSGAAGAVGSAVGAFASGRDIRAVGIAGGADKMAYLTGPAGYAAAVDRHAPDFPAQLKAALPEGADVYFDNVGGPMLIDVLPVLKRGALLLVSGLMAQYQGTPDTAGRDNLPAVMEAVMSMGLRIQSFSQFGQDALRPAFRAEVADLVAAGLESPIHVQEGLDRLPHALIGLFTNSVAGKVVVRIAQPTAAPRDTTIKEMA